MYFATNLWTNFGALTTITCSWMKNLPLFAGWGKEEIIHHKEQIIHHKEQVSVALTACKYLLSSLYKRVEERDTATAVSSDNNNSVKQK